jgi:integrase
VALRNSSSNVEMPASTASSLAFTTRSKARQRWRVACSQRCSAPWDVRRRGPALGQEPARRFLQAIHGNPLEAVYTVALTTGLRIGEVLGLRWQDVDLAGRVIDVTWKLLQLGKELVAGAPKTQAGQRRVELHAEAIAARRTHRVRQAEQRVLQGGGLAAGRSPVYHRRE